MKTLQEFIDQFKFDSQKNLFIGVERECHLLDLKGNIAPIASRILKGLSSHNGQFIYELSACQLEWRVGPCKDVLCLKEKLNNKEVILGVAEERMGFSRSFVELAPNDMPLDVYPDPTGRYQEITRDMPKKVLSAACRVIATHIHIGMPDQKTALRTYNKVIEKIDYLREIGDHSNGERLKIYSTMAPNYISPHYENWHAFYEKAKRENFINDPRNCWTLIRISKHGTIEFRMFGATKDINEILEWASFCQEICKKAQH
ncbi:hypothetical protein AMJ47_02005 [Parcubacteria bacterium DG_72]|nr:MAG: hypothetical protein AMJ47_02005 [Parcubacteria bacterium DG_72]